MVATKAPAEKIAEVRAGKHVTATEIAGVES